MTNSEVAALAARLVVLEDQRDEIGNDIADLKKEARAKDIDPKILADTVRVMRMEGDKRAKKLEQLDLFNSYLEQVGIR